MTRTVVIGATGHIGGYLVPRLVEAGHDVVAVSRGEATPYRESAAWQRVETVRIDREAAEAAGDFGTRIRDLEADVVVDLICFTLDSARHLTDALTGSVRHLIHIGSIWSHGVSTEVPTTEECPSPPFGEYGVAKAAIADHLLGLARTSGFPATVIHPGHIVGPGWAPLNPAGHFDTAVFDTLARGEELALPHFGLETVHHVHADDVAGLIMAAIDSWGAAVGEAFHSVSAQAVTLRGYAEAMSRWFGHEPRLTYLPWDAWADQAGEENAQATWEHIARSPNCSMAKAERLLGFRPGYGSVASVIEAVTWLQEQGRVARPTH